MRDLALPFLSMLAVIGCVYLVAQYWPGSDGTRMPKKINVLHHTSRHAPATSDSLETEAHKSQPTQHHTAADNAQTDDNAPLKAEALRSQRKRWTTLYDEHFRKYTKRYFSVNFDWRWFKSQAIVESTLNPHAHSRAGAVGLMQIKPLTFGDIQKHNPKILNLHTPRWNIAAGIFYVRRLYDKDAIKRLSGNSRLYLSFASYNAGYTRMLRVMRRVPPEDDGWRNTLKHGPTEARHYVERIITVKSKFISP